MAVEVEDVVKIGVVGEHAGELLEGGRPKHIQTDAVAVGTEQFEQATGDGLKRHGVFRCFLVIHAVRTTDDQQDVEGRFIGPCGRRLENQIGLAADEGVGKARQVTITRQRRVAHQFPRQRDALGTVGVDDDASVG